MSRDRINVETTSATTTFQIADCSDMRVAIVASRWHSEVMDGLVTAAQRALTENKVGAPVLARVASVFELPVMAQAFALQGFDAIVALGVVVRGETAYFDLVTKATVDGLGRVALDHSVPIGLGLLSVDSIEEAVDRAGLPGSSEDRGYEAACAALETAQTLTRIHHHHKGGLFR